MNTLRSIYLGIIAALLLSPSFAAAQDESEKTKELERNRARKSQRVRGGGPPVLRDRAAAGRVAAPLLRGGRPAPAPPAPAPGADTRTPAPPAPGAPAPGAPAAAPPPPSAGGALPGEKEFNECLRIPPGRRVKITLKQESDLMDLVGWISSMTCRKFIVATSLRAQKVTIVSPVPVTPGEAYRAFLSALEVMGLTVAPAGTYLKIVQGNWAIQSSIPTYADKDQAHVPQNDAVVTQMMRVQNVDANELLLVLNKMKSRSGDVTSYKPTNTLIITDVAYNVRRMAGIVKELDVAAEGEKIWVVRLKNADVEEVNKILGQIFGQGGRQGSVPRMSPAVRGVAGPSEEDVGSLSASKIVTDPATNSLIIVATPTSFARIASLIKKLDVEAEGSNQKINVYYLENADAEQMSATLAALTGAAVAGRGPSRGARASAPRPAGQPGTTATLFEGEVKITADAPTNSLVIIASPKDFLSVRSVIRKLDIPRRQVFVEASIMEISLTKGLQLGFAYHGGGTVGEGSSQSIIFGGLQHKDWSSLVINPLSLMGLAVGARGQTIDGSGRLLGLQADIPGFGVMFQALQNNSDVNILSSPHILTTDNEQAEITVGQNLPFQGSFMGGSFGAAAGAAGASALSYLPAISVQRQDVVLKLKIKPHVNESDMVRLELEQEVSDIVSDNYNGLGPATSKRTAKTMVVVRDQQTVVIGGLMGNRMQTSESKIPLLGDIPLLGYLFKYKTKSAQKTNLLIVLTPYVIRDQSDLRRIFQKKLEERREYIERYTSFTLHVLRKDIDYRHKRGLIMEIS